MTNKNKRITKLVIIATAIATLLPTYASHAAETTKTIAILDTAIDTTKVQNIVHEVCVTDDSTCPNNQSFMDGAGSANVPAAGWTANGITHGTEVSLTAEQANPNLKIVFVRISDIHIYPTLSATHTSDQNIDAGLQWVVANAQKYNISAVSISQTRYNFTTCPTDSVLISATNSLKNMNIPVFAGVPDNGQLDQLSWPACSTNVISVGAAALNGTPYYFSNYGKWVQFMGIGRTNVTYNGKTYAVMGTSIATPWLAALWVSRFSGTWQQQVDAANKSPRTFNTTPYFITYPLIK